MLSNLEATRTGHRERENGQRQERQQAVPRTKCLELRQALTRPVQPSQHQRVALLHVLGRNHGAHQFGAGTFGAAAAAAPGPGQPRVKHVAHVVAVREHGPHLFEERIVGDLGPLGQPLQLVRARLQSAKRTTGDEEVTRGKGRERAGQTAAPAGDA